MSKLKGVTAEWITPIHEGLNEQEKTYNRLKTMLRQRFGRQETKKKWWLKS